MPHTYEYPRPAVTVDLVVLHRVDPGDTPSVLLVGRKKDPFRGRWAIPGGFLNEDETTQQAATRELLEETGYRTNDVPRLIGVWDRPDRDPRGRTITVAYGIVISTPSLPLVEGADDAEEARWMRVDLPETMGPCMAFDHEHIVDEALGRFDMDHCVSARRAWRCRAGLRGPVHSSRGASS